MKLFWRSAIVFATILHQFVNAVPLGIVKGKYSHIAVPQIKLSKRYSPLAPSQDPFYTPPSGYEDASLGSVLRIRKQDNGYGMLIFETKVEEVYQILVRSENTFHEPIAVLTTLFVPYNADPSKLLSYQAAIDSSSPDCAASYAMQLGSAPATWMTPNIEQSAIVGALKEGYYVSVPDHLGPNAALLAGFLEGYTVLNSIRGVLNTRNITGIDSDANVVIWGYSGGAHSTGWAAQLRPDYAPELNLLGAAMGGILVNIQNILNKNAGTLFAGFLFSTITGLANEYPEIEEFTKQTIYPKMYPKLEAVRSLCLMEFTPYYVFQDWSKYVPEGVEFMSNPVIKNVTDSLDMLQSGLIPDVPLFFYSSQNDEILPTEDTDKLVELYCSKGLSVEYRKDKLSEHMSAAVTGAGLAFNFIKDRFDGVEVNPQCQNSTVLSNLFVSGSYLGLQSIGLAILEVLLNQNIGPGAGNTTVKIIPTLFGAGKTIWNTIF